MQFLSHIRSYTKNLPKVFLPVLAVAIFGFGIASIVAQSSQLEPVLGFAWNGNTPTATHLGCLDLTVVQSPNPGQIVTTQSGSSSNSGQLNPNQVPGSGQISNQQGGNMNPGQPGQNTQPNSVPNTGGSQSAGLPGCGLGWIGMNSQTPGNNGTVLFGVNLDMISGALSGYAFARSAPDPSNPGNDWLNTSIGWISFNPTPACPNFFIGNVNNCAPRVNLSTGKVTGWIRVCSVLTANCSGGLHPQAGGWDGWIKLSDDNPSFHYVSPDFTSNGGVTYSAVSGDFCGYAWGGPVGGWIDFGSGPNCSDTIIIDPLDDLCPNIPASGPPTIENPVPDGMILDSNGDCVDDPDDEDNNSGSGGKLVLEAIPDSDTTDPYRTKLRWNSVLTSTTYQSCQVIDSNGASTDPIGWVSGTSLTPPSNLNNYTVATAPDSVEILPTPPASTLYKIACTNQDGTDTASDYAFRGDLVASVNVTGPGCLQQSLTPPDTTDINWTATANVDVGSCVFSSNAPDGSDIGEWDDQNPTGVNSGSLQDYSLLVLGNYSFTLTCDDINGDPVPSDTTTVSYQTQACAIGPGGAPRPRFEEN